MPEYPDRGPAAAERYARAPFRVRYDLRRVLHRRLMVNMMAMMNMAMMAMFSFSRRQKKQASEHDNAGDAQHL
jgi:hypothetical protein